MSEEDSTHFDLAHGIMASVAWVVFFPLGSVALRLIKTRNSIWIHAGIQGFSIALLTAALGTGIVLAQRTDQMSEYHPIIGLVLYALVFIQAAGGLLGHRMFKKHQRRTLITLSHIWLGRTIITLGMINGGLGLMLADNASNGEIIAYGVIAGVIWFAYMSIAVWYELRRTEKPMGDLTKEKPVG